MNMNNLIKSFLIFFSSFYLSLASVINVPADTSTIQGGLYLANEGDTVLVQPDVYFEKIIWPNVNNIKLISSGNKFNTIIDGNNSSSRLLNISSNGIVDTTTEITGFSFINGGGLVCRNAGVKINNSNITDNFSYDYGAGLSCENSNIILNNCNVDLNNIGHLIGSFYNKGGGIYGSNSNISINNCSIYGNSTSFAADEVGGGIYVGNSNLYINNSNISSNFTNLRGGGVYLYHSNAFLNNVTILKNVALYGGGIFSQSSSLNVQNTSINRNGDDLYSTYPVYEGGGICLVSTQAIFNDVLIHNNLASGSGAGIHVYNSSPVFNATSIIGNRASYLTNGNGGGVRISGPLSKPIFNNCTIANNKSIKQGGGIYSSEGASTIFNNCSVVGNKSKNGGGIYWIGDTLNMSHCTISGNEASNNGDGVYIDTNILTDIDSCNFAYNGVAFFNNNNTILHQLENNYWGDESGPFHSVQNQIGLGDSVNIYTNITPFLTYPDIVSPPIPIQNLSIVSIGSEFIEINWDSTNISDLAGYKVYYKTDSTCFFYTDTIDVGKVTSYNITNLNSNTNYFITGTCYDNFGNESWYFDEINQITLINSIQQKSGNNILKYDLYQNYPNPFNPNTIISYYVPYTSKIEINLYNTLGQKIKSLYSGVKNTGKYLVKLSGNELASGVYYYELKSNSFKQIKKCILIR